MSPSATAAPTFDDDLNFAVVPLIDVLAPVMVLRLAHHPPDTQPHRLDDVETGSFDQGGDHLVQAIDYRSPNKGYRRNAALLSGGPDLG